MTPLPLTVETDPALADLHFVEAQINAYNMAQSGYYDYQPLAIFARDPEQNMIAGVTGFTWGQCCVIEFLWVQEAQRQHGYGTALMQKAEAEARTRGCHVITVNTHSFQAPDFYAKLGFTVVGVQEDFPAGHQHYTFSKRLDEQSAGAA